MQPFCTAYKCDCDAIRCVISLQISKGSKGVNWQFRCKNFIPVCILGFESVREEMRGGHCTIPKYYPCFIKVRNICNSLKVTSIEESSFRYLFRLSAGLFRKWYYTSCSINFFGEVMDVMKLELYTWF